VKNENVTKQVDTLVWLFLFLFITSEDETHSGFRNVVSKFTAHIVKKRESQKKKNVFARGKDAGREPEHTSI
jgi:hypothetical protein